AACRRAVEECDLLVLLVAFRQGWVPTRKQGGDGRRSISAYELQAARHAAIPVRALLARESWPGSLWEEDAKAREAVRQVRDDLNQIAEFFDIERSGEHSSEPLPGSDFRSRVRKVLLDHRDWLLKPGALGATRHAGRKPV